MQIGVQLYTLRKYGQSESALAEMLPRVRAMGYTTVQYSGCALFPSKIKTETLKKMLDDNGLKVCLTHVQDKRIFNETDALAEEHVKLGCPTVGLGCMPQDARLSSDAYGQFVDNMNKASEVLSAYGLRLAYHNHAFEFDKLDGEMLYERLLKDFSSDILFTMDTYWVKFAGYDPVEWMKRLNGRITDLHIKDWTDKVNFIEKYLLRQKQKMVPIGAGQLDFRGIFAQGKAQGIKHAFIELDTAKKPYDALQQSTDYLNRIFPDKTLL